MRGLLPLAVLPLLAQAFMPAVVRGSSMAPTIPDGAIVLEMRTPLLTRGAMVAAVVELPWSGRTTVLKRVVGLPGDQVELRRDKPVRVPEGQVYLVGDNSQVSYDSREFGPVPLDRIRGVVILRLH